MDQDAIMALTEQLVATTFSRVGFQPYSILCVQQQSSIGCIIFAAMMASMHRWFQAAVGSMRRSHACALLQSIRLAFHMPRCCQKTVYDVDLRVGSQMERIRRDAGDRS